MNIRNLNKPSPKRDGSGKGIRANRGRKGCNTTRKVGLGRKSIK